MPLPHPKPESAIVWRGRPRPRTAYTTTGREYLNHWTLLVLLALLTALTPRAAAQRAAHAPAFQHFNSPAAKFATGQTAHFSGFRHSSPYTSLPFPFFSDFFNPDDIYSTGYPVASQPPAFLLQAAQAMSGSADYFRQPAMARPAIDNQPSTQPLMIELQNGHYVRVTSTPADGEALPLTVPRSSHPGQLELQPPAIATASPAQNLPPVALVFRDGHTEEVRDYTIADGILYARGDYYTDGYWNKKIALATLNVSQTLQANNGRNVKFLLPSSPNEVITRP
jgi:hypothetical protein